MTTAKSLRLTRAMVRDTPVRSLLNALAEAEAGGTLGRLEFVHNDTRYMVQRPGKQPAPVVRVPQAAFRSAEKLDAILRNDDQTYWVTAAGGEGVWLEKTSTQPVPANGYDPLSENLWRAIQHVWSSDFDGDQIVRFRDLNVNTRSYLRQTPDDNDRTLTGEWRVSLTVVIRHSVSCSVVQHVVPLSFYLKMQVITSPFGPQLHLGAVNYAELPELGITIERCDRGPEQKFMLLRQLLRVLLAKSGVILDQSYDFVPNCHDESLVIKE